MCFSEIRSIKHTIHGCHFDVTSETPDDYVRNKSYNTTVHTACAVWQICPRAVLSSLLKTFWRLRSARHLDYFLYDVKIPILLFKFQSLNLIKYLILINHQINLLINREEGIMTQKNHNTACKISWKNLPSDARTDCKIAHERLCGEFCGTDLCDSPHFLFF